ncbi:MAG: dihydroorotate dehydrogenase, partial [Bacteroidota bacterium]
LRTLRTAVLANVAASTVQEYCDIVRVLDDQDGVAGYEINVSCPNVKEGGLSFGTDCAMTREITSRLRKITERPLIIKLTPNVTHISEFARAVEDAGADAVSVVNTLIGMAIDIRTRKPKLSTVTGGLSGPAIKPVALAKVYEVAQVVAIPIFGIGGISTAEDAVEFLLAGATAVQLGSINYVDPGRARTVIEGIHRYAEQMGVKDVGALVGSLDAKLEYSAIQSWL